MNTEKVNIQNVTVRFRMSYDKSWSLKDKAAELARTFLHRRKPQYFIALEQINMKLYDGDIVGVIGPNGCGKTTLLRTICGIYHPDEGVVDCHGRVSTLLSLGTGFDNKLNGIDNIRLNGLIMGMTVSEIESKIPMILEFADIGEHINVPMKYYSSGMISRVSFAIVLAMQPDILLIDEVFSVGDLQFTKKSERAMHELLSQASCQVIVSHNLTLIREHCNRAVYICEGKIRAEGSPDDVVAQYEKECS